jgi:hypothetical protein
MRLANDLFKNAVMCKKNREEQVVFNTFDFCATVLLIRCLSLK